LKGPGFRERQSVNWKRFMTEFKTSLDECVNKWASTEEQDVSCLNEWKVKVLHDVQNAIKRLNKRRYNQKRKTMILKSPKVMSELAELQKKYVFVPTDKAANNIAVVCKRFYIEKTMKELNIFSDDQKNQNLASSTYTTYDKGIDAIVKRHIRYMKMNFENSKDTPEELLPFLYWIPKMHKKPYSKQRYIAASKCCSTKPLSAILTKCLKLIEKQHRITN
jgi:hypothetical protein